MARVKNSVRNIVFSMGLQLVTTIINFVIRRIMVDSLGMQAYSLNGLFTEVLAALSLAELGIGSAIVYNLYKPLAENDTEKVRQLMRLFKTAYRWIALTTFVIGLCICPFIQLIVNSVDYSDAYIRLVYMLFVLDLSISYLFSYKVSLMNADQKNYIQSKISMGVSLGGAGIKIAVLYFSRNFVVYLCTSIFITFLGNLVRSYVVDRYYPWLKEKAEPLPREERKEVFSNIKNLFVKSLSGKITNSTDNMLISALVNTLQVGIYTNYAVVIGIFRQFSNNIAYGGVGASLGNLLVTEDEEKCAKVIYRLLYLFYIIGAVSAVGVFCAIDPFIVIWMKKTDYLLEGTIVFLCCLNMFMEILNRPLWSVMEVSGLFSEDKWVSIAGSVVNLVVSVVVGLRFGMIGIFIGTFLTYLIQAILKARLLFKIRLHSSPKRYYGMATAMFVGTILQMCVAKWICHQLVFESYLTSFVVYAVIALLVAGGSIVLFTFRTEAFRYYWSLGIGVVKNKILKR